MSITETLTGIKESALGALEGLVGSEFELARTRTLEELPGEGTLYQYLPPIYRDDGTIYKSGSYDITPRGYQTLIAVGGVVILFMLARR